MHASDGYLGIYGQSDSFDVISSGALTNNSLYGVALIGSVNDTVWNNDFVGNDGATTTYSPSHIQAVDSGTNDRWFECAPGGGRCYGNYWADWHTYLPSGRLAPYLIDGSVYDYYPLGLPVGQSPVTFTESGLVAGTTWSVTFNGITRSSTGSEIVFGAAPGTYNFLVSVPQGYSATPSSGSVTTVGGPYSAAIRFAAIYAVTLTESGLPSGTAWSAIFGGVASSSTTATMTFSVPQGLYAYQIESVPGYTVTPRSGSATVSGTYALMVTYEAVPTPTYAVTLSEGGLAPGTVWSATVNGMNQSTSGPRLTFYLPNGTYSYAFNTVPGYSLGSGAAGSLTVSGSPVSTAATYVPPPTYTVSLTETGLATGTTWSATLGGVTLSTSGASLVFTVPAGTYNYSFAAVSGYDLGSGSTGSLSVAGSGASAAVTYTPHPAASVASTSDLNTYFAASIALAVIALVVALVALLLRRGTRASAPPKSWTPPPPAGGEEGAAPGQSWSEGPPGGTPKN